MKQTIQNLLKDHPVAIIDGSMSTTLETMGCDLNDRLWTAKILMSEPEKIKEVHRRFFHAGADIVITASYQASIPGFMARGFSESEAEDFLTRAVVLAQESRDEWWKAEGEALGRSYPLIGAAVGPYGAYTADGAEYRGNYSISADELREFHRRRLEVLWAAKPDLLAIETIPSLEEAIILCELVEEMGADCWMTFSCRNDHEICDGTDFEESVKAVTAFSCVHAVGLNCTAPQYTTDLIHHAKAVTDTPIMVYPNSGGSYDACCKVWTRPADVLPFGDYVKLWAEAGATLIGGCCQTTVENIVDAYQVLRGTQD